MRSFTYPALVRRDQAGRYLVTFPDLPRCATDGPTRAEALVEAADALGEAIAHRITPGSGYSPAVAAETAAASGVLVGADVRQGGIVPRRPRS